MKFYFTFGSGQKHEGGYHVIEEVDELSARAKMLHRFGAKWSMMYTSAEDAGVEMWNLELVEWDGVPYIEVQTKQDKAYGQLDDLLALDSGLTDNEVKWIEILSHKNWLTDKDIKVIDDIYERRC